MIRGAFCYNTNLYYLAPAQKHNPYEKNSPRAIGPYAHLCR